VWRRYTSPATARTPIQNEIPKGSFGARAAVVFGIDTEYPGPKAAEVTEVACWGAVVAWGRADTPPKVPRFIPGID
jgi:hypothetical protein